ncbi:tetraacyldisaccharide 4'-kinase, partial [bacterium]|nr:tetraacyldisaccharide 4'-kinase [bacterium]
RLLAPLGLLYGLGAALNGAWQAARAWEGRLPVLSVGNLEIGGTGKTPTVALLAQLLAEAGWRPGVVTGLWGRPARGHRLLSREAADFARAAPDEARLLAARLPGLPLVAARPKWEGARWLEASGRCDLLIVDDGFQHRRLARHLDLVLLSPGCALSPWRLLPAGPLREFPGALARASAYALAVGEAAPARWPAPVLRLVAGAPCLVELDGRPAAPWPDGYLSVAGIARPERFEAAAAGAGLALRGRLRVADHADWTPRLRRRIAAAGAALRGARVLLTEKDAQRWASSWDLPGPAPQVLAANLQLADPAAALALLRERLGGA